MDIWEIIQAIVFIYIVLKLMVINHNQGIIVDNQRTLVKNQKTLDKNLSKLSGKDKSILDDIFKEK